MRNSNSRSIDLTSSPTAPVSKTHNYHSSHDLNKLILKPRLAEGKTLPPIDHHEVKA